MSRTYKDKPYRLGGDRHRYFIANNHGAHTKFIKTMSRCRRRYEIQYFRKYGCLPQRNPREYEYFD